MTQIKKRVIIYNVGEIEASVSAGRLDAGFEKGDGEMKKSIFTAEELEELRRFDEEIDRAEFTIDDYELSDYIDDLLFPERVVVRERQRQNYQKRGGYAANKEKIDAYYQKNKDRVRETHKAWYEANKERIKAQQKAYRDRKKAEALAAANA